jgi:hypothetical protein
VRRIALALFLTTAAGCEGPAPLDASDAAVIRDTGLDAPRDTGHGDEPSPDACPEPGYCPPFMCTGGQVLGAHPITTPCPACSYVAISPSPCEAGCLEGQVSAGLATDLCRPAVQVGDPCRLDSECNPADADPGYGGAPTPVTLHCDAARFVCASVDEGCNARDDDADGTVDEGCTCVPRATVLSGLTGIPSRVVFGPNRILSVSWSDVGSSIDLVDASGAGVGHVAVANGVSTPSRNGLGFVYVDDLDATSGSIVSLGPDGMASAPRVPIHWTDIAAMPSVEAWGADFFTIGRAPSAGAWSIARVTSGGSEAASGTLTTGNGWVLGSLADGTPLVLDVGARAPIRVLSVDASGVSQLAAAPSADRVGPTVEVATTADRIWIPARDASGDAILAAIDRTTGAWAETIALGPISTAADVGDLGASSIHLAAHGAHLFASWPDLHGDLRIVVLDTSGTRLGEATLLVGVDHRAPVMFFTGDTDLGVRIVIGVRIYAPCDAL